MAEVKYKSLIPKFNSQEEMDSCKTIKITGNLGYGGEFNYKIFDKNEDTSIKSGVNGNIYFDFLEAINIKQIKISSSWDSSYYSSEYIEFYGSNNKESWESICTFKNSETTKNITNNSKYRFYRISYRSQYGWEFFEIDLFVINSSKFLIKQNNDYYALKSNFYCIGQPQSNTELESWYEKYGVDEPNVLLEPINKEQINMSLDEASQIWSTDKPIDFNRIKNTIELIEEGNSKSIQYGINPYRIYDKLNSDAILTMATDKENN